MESKKNFSVIQCKDYIYIKDDASSYSSNIPSLLFDGVKAESTYKDGWYKLCKIPEKIEKKLPDTQINVRFELKAGYTQSEMMPQVINLNSLYESEYEEVSGLYEKKYDTEDGGYEDVKFEVKVIYKKDDFDWVKTQYHGSPDLLAQIENHPAIYQECPQSLSSEQMFEVIRNYVKANINNLVAHISSDYDFQFQVDRKILIAEPYSYDTNLNSGNKRRKPNWVKKWVTSKNETVLNIKRRSSDTSYGNDCTLAPRIDGNNALDLEKKVNEYLKNLMKEINKEYKECPCCKGWGVVEVNKNEQKDVQ